MSFFEFPHTRTYDSDLGWLIKKMEELLNEYNELVSWKLSMRVNTTIF